MRVLIDPGHGPGNANRGPTGYFEHEGMWLLSNFLQTELRERGITADLTRSESQDPTLLRRGQMARGYSLFVSQHSNAFNGRVRGAEVFYSVRQPSNERHAAALSDAVAWLMRNPDRGAKIKRNARIPASDHFGVIRHAVAVGCPHVYLAENGFHDNLQDEAWLKNTNNLRALADVQAQVIQKILGGG